jgi:APA family basic amino acid/polyamine antiporter
VSDPVRLKRSLSLTQMVLYGVGTTVGAGIYALIGEIAGIAGNLAPWSFLFAATMAAFTAFSFAQFSARFPQAAGAALYVQHGFGLPQLGLLVGILVIAAGTVSAAALLNGFVGYLQEFVALPSVVIILVASILLCAIAVWGIAESVWIAGVISVIEVAGLLWITMLATEATDFAAVDPSLFVPDLSLDSWSIVIGGSVLAFYAYIGFEDMVVVAEEVKDVSNNLPRAILLTMVITTVIYTVLVTSVILATGPELLANSRAPLADVYQHLTNHEPFAISIIGMFAITNGALIQVIMASRVLYGLSSRGQLPNLLGWVHPVIKTPIPATLLASTAVLLLALVGDLASLAELTAVTMLVVFALVNWALCRLLWHETKTGACIALFAGAICAGFVARTVFSWFS